MVINGGLVVVVTSGVTQSVSAHWSAESWQSSIWPFGARQSFGLELSQVPGRRESRDFQLNTSDQTEQCRRHNRNISQVLLT